MSQFCQIEDESAGTKKKFVSIHVQIINTVTKGFPSANTRSTLTDRPNRAKPGTTRQQRSTLRSLAIKVSNHEIEMKKREERGAWLLQHTISAGSFRNVRG